MVSGWKITFFCTVSRVTGLGGGLFSSLIDGQFPSLPLEVPFPVTGFLVR
jgi:hypothetical protein